VVKVAGSKYIAASSADHGSLL